MVDFGFLVSAGAADVAVEVYGNRAGPRLALVSWARRGADVAVVAGRLHYTGALGARIGSPPTAPGPEPAGRGDAELALGCYQREGISGLAQLEGDFAAVVWDGRRRRFVARRDPFGRLPAVLDPGRPVRLLSRPGSRRWSRSCRPAPSTPVSWPRAC